MMNKLNESGQIIAVLSFVIGTILLAFFLYFGELNFPLGFGIVFIVLAFMVNLVLVIVLIGSAIINPKHRLEALKTCGLMLLNIPVVIFYIYLIKII